MSTRPAATPGPPARTGPEDCVVPVHDDDWARRLLVRAVRRLSGLHGARTRVGTCR